MIITCISECTKKALPRSQRVLSKYLPQIGRRSWQGPLSQEGLANLIDELKTDLRTRHRKQGLSRHTAVAIYRNRGTSETRLISIIGSHQGFSPEGHYCFSIRQRKQALYTPLTRWQQLQLCVLRLAALFHDLGKATVGFQAKLNAHSNQADAIRHEVVSWLLLSELLRKPADGKNYDHHWLAQLDTPEKVATWFDQQAAQLHKRPPESSQFRQAAQAFQWAPLLSGIGWLVLSHHRLPAPLRGELAFQALAGDHSRMVRKGASNEEQQAFLTFPDSPALPWRQHSWQKAVASQVEKLKTLRHKAEQEQSTQPPQPLLPGFGPKDSHGSGWMGMLYHHLRPLLVASDYLGSQQKQPYRQQPTGHNRFAETEQILANTLNNAAADSLTDHLLKVARWTRQLWLELEQWPQRMPDWQQLDSAELPKAISPLRLEHNIEQGIQSRIRGVPERFRWQAQLQQQLVAARLKTAPDTHPGFFGVMLAETGAGKTRAALTAMCAATGHARLTTALGYRSLTVQTSQAYRDELGLRPHQLATLVGVSLEKALYQQGESDNTAETDTDNGAAGCPDNSLTFSWHNVERYSSVQHPLASLGSASLQPLLEQAVVVATTDHLAHALEGDRGSQLLSMFRIASADTLFDELDSYSDQDLVSLGRWAWCCGYFGRALMLVSATLSPALVEQFAAQYYAGLAQFQQRTGKRVQVLNMLASNQRPAEVFHSESLDGFSARYQAFTPALAQISQQNARTLPRRRLDWLADSTPGGITEAIAQLHQHHGTTFSHRGQRIRVSTGYLLCDTVANCQQQALTLAASAPPHWKLLSYHSAYTLLDRYLIEQAIAPLLNRKDEPQWQQRLLNHPALADHLQQHHELTLVICCTNILETGRDFDADWAIADLLSVRSLVQLAGRVGRHRLQAVTQPNLYLRPQPGSFARQFCQRGRLSPAQRALEARDNRVRLGSPFGEQIIQAAPLLHPASCDHSPHLQQALESQQQQLRELQQLRSNPLCWPNNRLAREKRFRAGQKSQLLFNHDFDQPVWREGDYQQENWYCCDYPILTPNRQLLNDSNRLQLPVCTDTPDHWLLESESRALLWEQSPIQQLSPGLLHSLQTSADGNAISKLQYSSAVGMQKVEHTARR